MEVFWQHITILISAMPSMSNCTFRKLFEAKSLAPKDVEAVAEVVKLGKSKREPGWLRKLCKVKNEDSSLVYLRAVLASQLKQDKELEKSLEQAWGSDTSFHPNTLFPPKLEPQPVAGVLNEVKRDPIAYIQKVLAEERAETGWLRKQIFPGSDKWLKESEKRMLRLQVCLLVGLGKAPNSVQSAWGISKSVFRYILADLRGLFEGPISIVVAGEAQDTTPKPPTKWHRYNTPMGVVARFLTPSDATRPNKGTETKDLLHCHAEDFPDTAGSTPSPDHEEGAFFIEEDLTILEEEQSAPIAKPSQPSLRKTVVAGVLSPLKTARLMAGAKNSTDANSPTPDNAGTSLLEESSVKVPAENADDTSLDRIKAPITTACCDEDGEAIEVALDGEEASGGDNPSMTDAGEKIIRVDLNRLFRPSTGQDAEVSYDNSVLSQFDVLRQHVEKRDMRPAYAIEIQTAKEGIQDMMVFCQVFESENPEVFERKVELHGWLDQILEASISSRDPSEAAKCLVACLGKKYPQALATAAEEFGFMKVVGPEI